jgi:nuclear cap-binding protein subunit 2
MTFEDQLESLKGATTLYVGNLSFLTTELQIRETFSRVGPIKRIIMGLNRETKAPCGFCFVEYYSYEHACACLKYISGTMCDGQIIRCELDGGFKPGRQYGRGKSGGQVRNEKAASFNDRKPSFTPPSTGKRNRSDRDSFDRRPNYDGRDRRDSYDKGRRDSYDRDRRDSYDGRDGRRVVVDERRRDQDRGGYRADRSRHGDGDRDRRSGGDSRRGREDRDLDSRLTSELSSSRIPRTREEDEAAAAGRIKENQEVRHSGGASAGANDDEDSGGRSRGRRRGGDSDDDRDEDETSEQRFRRDGEHADDGEAGGDQSREQQDN